MLDYHPLEISKVQKSNRFLKLSGATCATFLDVKSSGRIWISEKKARKGLDNRGGRLGQEDNGRTFVVGTQRGLG